VTGGASLASRSCWHARPGTGAPIRPWNRPRSADAARCRLCDQRQLRAKAPHGGPSSTPRGPPSGWLSLKRKHFASKVGVVNAGGVAGYARRRSVHCHLRYRARDVRALIGPGSGVSTSWAAARNGAGVGPALSTTQRRRRPASDEFFVRDGIARREGATALSEDRRLVPDHNGRGRSARSGRASFAAEAVVPRNRLSAWRA
jgi:hypothetical protein